MGLAPDAVLTLGDQQYEDGHARASSPGSYDPTWGRLRQITHPAAGNHEYGTADADGYFDYFGEAAGPRGKGWYSVDLGGWHVVALNSNCEDVGGCGPGSEQLDWLRKDLATHTDQCVLAFWHHPRWSNAKHGDDDEVAPFVEALYEANADVVLTGHDHAYQRFVPREPDGQADQARGVRSSSWAPAGAACTRSGVATAWRAEPTPSSASSSSR